MVVAASEHGVAVVVAASEHGQVAIEVTYKEWIARPEHRMRLLGVGLIGAECLVYARHARTRVAHAAPTTTRSWMQPS